MKTRAATRKTTAENDSSNDQINDTTVDIESSQNMQSAVDIPKKKGPDSVKSRKTRSVRKKSYRHSDNNSDSEDSPPKRIRVDDISYHSEDDDTDKDSVDSESTAELSNSLEFDLSDPNIGIDELLENGASMEDIEHARNIMHYENSKGYTRIIDRDYYGDAGPAPDSEPIDSNGNGLALTAQQQYIVDLVVKKGENLFFTGPAGSGKSMTLQTIIDELQKKYPGENQVAVTATTGIAAFQIGGTTLHSFAGIGLGEGADYVLLAKVRNFLAARNGWLNVKVLVIDEISMLDGELFDKLEFIARRIRRNDDPFGGIQVVVCGDFFQLPPVSKNKSAQFAFEAKSWNTVITNMIELTEVFRQRDQKFVEILNQLRTNQLTPENIEIIKKLERPLENIDGIEPTELYSLRASVIDSNMTRLDALPGEEVVYEAHDICDSNWQKRLDSNCIAPKEIRLKVGAQVMLTCNLDIRAGLVNGSIGRVVGFDCTSGDEKKPIIKFLTGRGRAHQLIRIHRRQWTFKENKKVVAERHQMPLILAWAWSIHKSQGQTIPLLKVDLGRVFEKGQAYVALSRAVSLDRLQVLHFHPKLVMVHPKVIEFSENILKHQQIRNRNSQEIEEEQ